ncbi:MAG: dienelactone hydrolase family protein [Pseudomonadota bacterium]
MSDYELESDDPEFLDDDDIYGEDEDFDDEGGIKLTHLNGPAVAPASGGRAKQLVVLLHGLGADGNDLISLVPQIAKVLPDAAFIAPNAPEPCDMAPMGYQWFSLQDRSHDAMLAGVEGVAPKLDGFLDEVLDYLDLTEEDVFLVGFSQGTMMALHVGMRRERQLGAIVGFSGALVGGDRLPQEVVTRPPVLLVHGDADEVVPFQAMQMAADALLTAEVPVEAIRRPGLAHGIDPQGMLVALRFINDHKRFIDDD